MTEEQSLWLLVHEDADELVYSPSGQVIKAVYISPDQRADNELAHKLAAFGWHDVPLA